jgi:hypothetical protein
VAEEDRPESAWAVLEPTRRIAALVFTVLTGLILLALGGGRTSVAGAVVTVLAVLAALAQVAQHRARR